VALRPRRDDHLIIEQDLCVQIVIVFCERPHQSVENHIEAPLAQFRQLQCRRYDLFHVECDTRILQGKPLDHRSKYRGRKGLRAPDAQLSGGRIGHELDLFDALLEIIERSRAALQQREAIHRGLDALWSTVQKPHAERMLEVGNDLGNGRLRDVEIRCSLGHAAASHDGVEDVQVAQLEAAADLFLPVDLRRHGVLAYAREMLRIQRDSSAAIVAT
jgi:hypothetical protein